jgi:hypothetical protein
MRFDIIEFVTLIITCNLLSICAYDLFRQALKYIGKNK